MDALLDVVMVLLGLAGSFFSGLLGIGGAIINYPLLLYVPASLGLAHFTAHEVSAISMFQVFFASLAGMLVFRKPSKQGGTAIHKGLVLYMGISTLAGSLAGGMVSGRLNGDGINLLYGVLAVVAVVLMLIPNRGKPDGPPNEIRFNKAVAVGSALAVGVVSGIVGAGGAFMLIPIMLTVLRIPTRTTIASSLAIVFLSAIGGVAGKLTGGAIPIGPTVFTVAGSLVGAPLGSRLSSRINVRMLRYGLVTLIALTAMKVWSSILLN